MWKVFFLATLMTATGPQSAIIKEKPEFKTEALCMEYAKVIAPRIADWIRGAQAVDWDTTVNLVFMCKQDGEPA